MNIRLKPILALTSLFFLLTWVVFLPAVSMAGTGRPLSPIFEDDMESGEGNWTHYTVTSGYVDQWHLSSQRNHTSGGSYSWKCGATDQFGNYANLNDAGLVTPTVTLPVGAYQLRLHHWMRAETAWGDVFESIEGEYGLILSQAGGDSTYNPEIPHISTLDWIAPDRAFWVKMDASGLLVLEGGRVEVLGGKYPPLSLHSGTEYSGWTLLPFLPGTRFYTDGQAKDAPEPSDLTGEAGFPAVSDTLRAGLNMEPVTWDQVERIQVIYPPPIGGTAYQRGLPDGFQSLKFLMPGYGLWLKMDEAYPGGEIIYQEP